MRGHTTLMLLVLLGAVTLTLAGCSGVGQTAAQVRGDPVRTAAADHVTAVLLVKSWFAILQPEPAGGGCSLEVFWEPGPGSSTRLTGRLSDCTTYEYLIQIDGSGTGTQTRLDGKTSSLTWTAPVWNDVVASQHIKQTLWDAEELEFDWSMDYGSAGSPQTWDGQAILPDGRAMTFLLDRVQDSADELRLVLSDGSQLYARVPLTGGVLQLPAYEQGATGSYTSAGGAVQEFSISGASGRWDGWTFTTAAGIEGSFLLGLGFIGNGQLNSADALLGALSWQTAEGGTLALLGASASDVVPSAAALDFQVDRWVTTIAAMGPSPTY